MRLRRCCVCIRQHTSAYVSIRQLEDALEEMLRLKRSCLLRLQAATHAAASRMLRLQASSCEMQRLQAAARCSVCKQLRLQGGIRPE
jgi:hypothetical protein